MKKVSKIFLGNLFVLLFCQLAFANKQEQSLVNILETQKITPHNIEIGENQNAAPSYLFNGTDSYIELEEQFDSTFSFCAWIKPADLLKKNMAIVGISGAFWFRTTTSRELQFTQPGIRDENTEGLLLSAGNWSFLSFVIDFPRVKIYLNSEIVDEFIWNGDKKNWNNKVLIGKDKWKEDFQGSMQNIQVFKNAIDENTIKELYAIKPFPEKLTDGAVLYHSFNSPNKYFSSGLNAETNNVQFLKDSVRGMAGTFNGKDSYIDFGELAIDNEVTIAAWVKQQHFNRDYGALVALGHAYALRITTGGALLFTIPQMADVSDNSAKLKPNEWQHVAVSFKETRGVTFYLNGEKKKWVEEENYQNVVKELEVGTNLWNDFFKGEMDDLIIWNKILTDADVKEVFQKESSFWEENIKTNQKSKPYLFVFGMVFLFLVIGSFLYLRNKRKKVALSVIISDPFQQKIQEMVFQNLSDSNFSVNEFAEAMHMSKTKLYNEIKASIGQSPKEYIRQIRIKEAARLLKESDLPITEIIFETGFESRAYFNKCFKEKNNATPSEYRKSSRINIT